MTKQNEKNIFLQYLSDKGLRDTRQRELVLTGFLESERHLSAEELYDIVKARDRTLGQATVYRVLKLLCEAGLAREVDFGDGSLRYEHALGHDHHDHFVCTSCGKTVEVVDPAIEALQRDLAEKYGFLLNDHDLYLYGICRECRERPAASGSPAIDPATPPADRPGSPGRWRGGGRGCASPTRSRRF